MKSGLHGHRAALSGGEQPVPERPASQPAVHRHAADPSRYRPRPGQRPFLDVIDWGAGIAPDIVDFIFDPFFTTTPKGTGLGLYIAKELCEGNGATLEYQAGEGKVGSGFRVTFARPEDCLEFGTV